jgi:hypothetical protein
VAGPVDGLDFLESPNDRDRLMLMNREFDHSPSRPEPHRGMLRRPEQILQRVHGTAGERLDAHITPAGSGEMARECCGASSAASWLRAVVLRRAKPNDSRSLTRAAFILLRTGAVSAARSIQ